MLLLLMKLMILIQCRLGEEEIEKEVDKKNQY